MNPKEKSNIEFSAIYYISESIIDFDMDFRPFLTEFKEYLSNMLFDRGVTLVWVGEKADLIINFKYLSRNLVHADVYFKINNQEQRFSFEKSFTGSFSYSLFTTKTSTFRSLLGKIAKSILNNVFKKNNLLPGLTNQIMILDYFAIILFFTIFPPIILGGIALYLGIRESFRIKKGALPHALTKRTNIGIALAILSLVLTLISFYFSTNNDPKSQKVINTQNDDSWDEINLSSDTTVIVKDFIHDGINDTMYKWFDNATQYGGQNVILVDGKTSKKYSITTCSKEANIKCLLNSPEYNDSIICATLLYEILPEKKEIPDPSLEWIIRAQSQNKKQLPYLSDIMCLPLKWYKGNLAQPTNYSIKIDNDSLRNILSAKKSEWLIYYGQFHRYPTIIQETPYGILYSTEVGLLLQRNDEYAWLLVADTKVTFKINKKTWVHIKDNLYYQDGYIVAQIGNESMKMIIIDLRNGYYAKVNTSKMGDVPNKMIVDALGKKLSAAF